MNVFLYPLLISASTVLIGWFLLWKIKQLPAPTTAALHLAELVEEGTSAFANRIISSMLQVGVYLTGVLFIFSWVFHRAFSWTQILALLAGLGLMTAVSLYSLRNISMAIPRIIAQSNGRLLPALSVLYQSSAAIGFFICGAVVFGLVICQWLGGLYTTIGYSVGCVFAAFFLRIGGGIFKSSADIADDISSKNNPRIPHFDRRNPATLLNITGNIIGEVVGFSSDILSTFIFAITASSLFSVSLYNKGVLDALGKAKLAHLPLYVMALSLLMAWATYLFGKWRLKTRMHNFLLDSIYVGIVLCGIGTYFVIRHLGIDFSTTDLWGLSEQIQLFIPYVAGLFGAVLIGFTAEIVTSRKYGSVAHIARQSSFGPVISLFNGLSLGLKSSGLYLLYILGVSTISLYFAGFYGLCLAALGMLSATPSILIANIFSPLANGTDKIARLANEGPISISNVEQMDKIGHTTAALGNGFASGTSVIATMALVFAFITLTKLDLSVLLLLDMPLFAGLVIGIGLPLVFSGALLSGLVRAIIHTSQEVSRQFSQIPYLMEDKAKPDMIAAAQHTAGYVISTLSVPGVILGFVPIAIGYLVGVKALFGLVLGVFLTGMNQGYVWVNTGDCLHNAKRCIRSGKSGGVDSINFSHIVVADNMGSAFRDMLGPSMNLLIKATSIIAVLVMLLLN